MCCGRCDETSVLLTEADDIAACMGKSQSWSRDAIKMDTSLRTDLHDELQLGLRAEGIMTLRGDALCRATVRA